MTDRESFLGTIFAPAGFSAGELARVLAAFRRVEISAGRAFARAGRVPERYWFLETGWARACVHNSRGDDITTQFFAPGDIVIDWSAFLTRQAARQEITAEESCTAWAIDFADFQALFDGVQAFRTFGRTNLVGAYARMQARHLSTLAETAEERYLRLAREQPDILAKAPQHQIASYLGITRTSLSRLRRLLVEKRSGRKPAR